MSDGTVPPSVTFWADRTSGAAPQIIVFKEGKDVFAILARTFKAVNDAAKRTLDNAKATGENSPSSSPSSSQQRNAPGPTPLVVPPSNSSLDKVPGAVPQTPNLFATSEPKETPRIQSGVSSARETVADTPPASAKGGVRDTSMAAYRALEWSGRLGEQEQTVVDFFLRQPNPDGWTRQELSRLVVWQGAPMPINSVCGRVNKLLSEPFNVLVELPERKTCSVTRNRVNALALALVEQPKEEEAV